MFSPFIFTLTVGLPPLSVHVGPRLTCSLFRTFVAVFNCEPQLPLRPEYVSTTPLLHTWMMMILIDFFQADDDTVSQLFVLVRIYS
jgi:hypothetical protein